MIEQQTLILDGKPVAEKILNDISGLYNYGGECHCDDREGFSYIHNGKFPEIMTICLNCGGIVV